MQNDNRNRTNKPASKRLNNKNKKSLRVYSQENVQFNEYEPPNVSQQLQQHEPDQQF